MNKRWRELADLAWDQIDSIYSSELVDGEIELAKHFILETIWTAVNEERERMVVVLPSDEDLRRMAEASAQKKIDQIEGPESSCGFSSPDGAGTLRAWWVPGFIAGYKDCYRWLSTHAKVGVRE